MKHGKFEKVTRTCLENLFHQPADSVTERVENDQNNYYTKYIEEHVGEGCTTGLYSCCHRCHNGCDCCTDVLSHGKCSSLFKAESRDMHIEEHKSDGHGGSRCLHQHGDQGSYNDKQDDGKETSISHLCQYSRNHRTNIKVICCLLQKTQTHEKKCKTIDKFADGLTLAIVAEDERQAKCKKRQRECCNVDLEANGRDYPRGNSCSDVSTHYDSDGLGEIHQSCINERHNHDSRGR